MPVQLVSALADRYRVERELGRGGMATVYLAHDIRHDRPVAIKVLRPELAAAIGSDRFLHEIRTTAGLRHPHILPLYDSGSAAAVLFYVMPFVEGESLRQRLDREGRLPLADALQFAREVADALDYAHGRGVVHRDIKPGNILVDRGHAFVADFGIARAVDMAGGDRLTLTGLSPGTPAYMSPEQAAGEPDLDGRSDLFSLGCVLFEMLAGQPPFTGASARAVIMKRVLEEAPDISRARDVPAAVRDAVARLLEREPAARFATGAEVARALLDPDVPSGHGSPDRSVPQGAGPSIAVLPFSDMSPQRDHEWFCDGIAEEVIDALTRLPGVRVATRTSAFRFRDPARDLARIGDALGVTTLLEGSVRTAGERMRVTAHLVNARDGYQLWSERFDREMADVFDVQDEIAASVVAALEPRLIGSQTAAQARRPSQDLEAYHLFLKGRHFRYTRLDLRSATQCFEQAVARDPSYAVARVALAESLVVMSIYGIIPPSAMESRAREQLQKARELDGESGESAGVDGLLALVYDWDSDVSLAAFERALALDPTHVPSRAWYTWTLLALGRADDALAEARRIVSLDPQSPYANAMAGLTVLMAGQVGEAVALTRTAVELEPDSLQATWMLALALAATRGLGRGAAAVRAGGRTLVRSPVLRGPAGLVSGGVRRWRGRPACARCARVPRGERVCGAALPRAGHVGAGPPRGHGPPPRRGRRGTGRAAHPAGTAVPPAPA